MADEYPPPRSLFSSAGSVFQKLTPRHMERPAALETIGHVQCSTIAGVPRLVFVGGCFAVQECMQAVYRTDRIGPQGGTAWRILWMEFRRNLDHMIPSGKALI